MKIEWNDPKEFPDELNPSGNGFSIDVLVYCESSDQNTIGWFDFKNMTWTFLCREPIGKNWKWRYISQEFDKYELPQNNF